MQLTKEQVQLLLTVTTKLQNEAWYQLNEAPFAHNAEGIALWKSDFEEATAAIELLDSYTRTTYMATALVEDEWIWCGEFDTYYKASRALKRFWFPTDIYSTSESQVQFVGVHFGAVAGIIEEFES